ncbi:AraC family transcriptional regulator [Actinotalea ferrariae]|uniref:AraC family transcriptional regulator n=1 Tax=Actinotalea ferrariae TaxID=1386098 RepID=UPI001C8C6663|nr:AraC family transcriptional regulator [Actinotalea ferrariae]MBX9245941.1 AraC family transcriptional regulator [Actinotalea ferrariae]
MDAVTGLLDGPRARGAFVLRCVMEPPWSLRVQDQAPLTLVAQVSGSSVISRGGPAQHLRAGEVAVLRGPDPYTMSDHEGTPPQAVVHPGQRCTTPDGVELPGTWHHGVRTWGNRPDGSTTMLVGTYELAGEVGDRLLRALPPVLVVPSGAAGALVPMLADELERGEPGQEAVLDRLLDLLLITVVRQWFARPDAEPPAWYAAWGDPVVGTALRAIHHSPAESWTVERLAVAAGVSRAALARRFTELVGEPPMTFLTGWRIALAADLLTRPDETVGSVARRVGYSTPFALSTAFKRVRGVSPQQHRARVGVA